MPPTYISRAGSTLRPRHTLRIVALTLFGLLLAPLTQAASTLVSSEIAVGGSLFGLSGTTPDGAGDVFFMRIDEPRFAENPSFGGTLSFNSSSAISASQRTEATVSSVGPLLDFDASFLIEGSSSVDFALDPGSSVSVNSLISLTLGFEVDVTSTFEISNSAFGASAVNASLLSFFQIADLNDLANPLFDFLPSGGGSFDGTGVLAPGSYQLQARISHEVIDNGSASQDLGFSFRVVPEPSIALLFGIGLACLGASRNRN